MRELVMATIADQPDIEVVGEVQNETELAAPEQNRGIFYWAVVDIRTKALESSEAGILNAVRERPILVGAAPN
jgi:DNA-binding NarL/FixJ family response regulator